MQWEGELVRQLEDREKENEDKEGGEDSGAIATETAKTPHSALSTATVKEESNKAEVIGCNMELKCAAPVHNLAPLSVEGSTVTWLSGQGCGGTGTECHYGSSE